MIQLVTSFFDWKASLSKEKRGTKIMFDIPGYYKWVSENELFDYFINKKL